MKRGTPDHPKVHTLTALLNIAQWGAVGILESLWHFTQKYAPAGDVGRYQDEAIARGIGWQENAATLVSALVSAGWLDRCSCHRVRVHGWPEHCDQYVKRAVNHKFLDCYDDESLQVPCNGVANALHVDPAVPCRAVPSLAEAEAVPDAGVVGELRPDVRPDLLAESAIWKARLAEERELLAAVHEISKRTGREATEVMREVTAYKRDDGTVVPGKANPAQLRSAERVTKSLEDAKAWLADLEASGEAAENRD